MSSERPIIVCADYSAQQMRRVPGNRAIRCHRCGCRLVIGPDGQAVGGDPTCARCVRELMPPGTPTQLAPGTAESIERLLGAEAREFAEELNGMPLAEIPLESPEGQS